MLRGPDPASPTTNTPTRIIRLLERRFSGMLKAHQAYINLEKNVLRIQGREVSFLAEYELPDKVRNPEAEAEAAAEIGRAHV